MTKTRPLPRMLLNVVVRTAKRPNGEPTGEYVVESQNWSGGLVEHGTFFNQTMAYNWVGSHQCLELRTYSNEFARYWVVLGEDLLGPHVRYFSQETAARAYLKRFLSETNNGANRDYLNSGSPEHKQEEKP